MSPDERRQFEQLPYVEQAISLRRWDDLAKEAGKETPPLAYYLALLEEVRQQPFVDSKVGIGSLDIPHAPSVGRRC
jgi:predicted HD phosphohydrolase